MAVTFIIDAGSDLNATLAHQMGVKFIPMTVCFGADEYRSGVDISNEEFYKKLVSTQELPTTSQPTPYDFERAYQEVIDNGDEAVVLCVSSELSGTYQSAVIAADGFEGNVFVVDTLAVSAAQRVLLEYGFLLRDRGLSAKEIAEELNRKKMDIRIMGAVETLEYLIKGGRLSKAAGAVGSVLGIRPVLHLCGGKLEVAGKARGAKAAITMTRNLVEQEGIDLSMPFALGYTGNDPAVIAPFLEAVTPLLDGKTAPIYPVGSTVGTHAGPGLFLAAFFKKP